MKAIYETQHTETDDERTAARFARLETPEQRTRRVQTRPVDPAQVAALRRLWAA